MRVRPDPPIETITLTWFCENCAAPIDNGEGWIEVSYTAIFEAQAKRQRIHANLDAKNMAGGIITPADLADMPDPVRWMAWHAHCLPNDVREPSYRMPISRVRSLAQLMTLHGEMTRKTWHIFTDFCDLRLFLRGDGTFTSNNRVTGLSAHLLSAVKPVRLLESRGRRAIEPARKALSSGRGTPLQDLVRELEARGLETEDRVRELGAKVPETRSPEREQETQNLGRP